MFKRLLNPAALHDEDVVTLSIFARFVWTYLPCIADREGRLEDKPMSIKLQLLPNDNVDMEAILSEIAERNFIFRYTIDNKKYIDVKNFLVHQKPHPNETQSKIPDRYGRINGKLIGKPMINQDLPRVNQDTQEVDQCSPNTGICNTDLMSNIKLMSNLDQKGNLIPSLSFDQNTFAILFGDWPKQDDPKFNERPKDAEAAFYRNINEDNFPLFEKAWHKRINLYKSDKSKDKRYALGSFRTFCEGRWKDVDKLEEYSQIAPKFTGYIVEKFAELKE